MIEIWLLGGAEAMVNQLRRRGWIDRPNAAQYRNLIEADQDGCAEVLMRRVNKHRGLRLLWRLTAFIVIAARLALKAQIVGRSLALLRLANALDPYARGFRLRIK